MIIIFLYLPSCTMCDVAYGSAYACIIVALYRQTYNQTSPKWNSNNSISYYFKPQEDNEVCQNGYCQANKLEMKAHILLLNVLFMKVGFPDARDWATQGSSSGHDQVRLWLQVFQLARTSCKRLQCYSALCCRTMKTLQRGHHDIQTGRLKINCMTIIK